MTGLPRALDARDGLGVAAASRHGVERSRAAGGEQDRPRRAPRAAPRLWRAGERPHEPALQIDALQLIGREKTDRPAVRRPERRRRTDAPSVPSSGRAVSESSDPKP